MEVFAQQEQVLEGTPPHFNTAVWGEKAFTVLKPGCGIELFIPDILKTTFM